MNAPILIFLFGVWFNPNMIVSLKTFKSDNDCYINLSHGRYQSGVRKILTDLPCDEAAGQILLEVHRQNLLADLKAK
jgi:hypothetical protein